MRRPSRPRSAHCVKRRGKASAGRAADQGPDSGADGFGERRPRGHECGQVGVDAPFALLVTTPGTTPGGDGRRNLLIGYGFSTRNGGTVDPVVAGSSPVALACRTKTYVKSVAEENWPTAREVASCRLELYDINDLNYPIIPPLGKVVRTLSCRNKPLQALRFRLAVGPR
jgi:hypothetical protein